MSERAFRCSFNHFLVFALLLVVLPGLAGASEDPRISPEERAIFEAVATPQAKGCQRCALAHKKCSSTCFKLAETDELGMMGSCLTACDNAVATCTCDQSVNLRSEDLVSFDWPATTKAAACHGNVSCQPNYPSCASWSTYTACGDAYCGSGPRCGDCICDEWGRCFCGPGPAWRESFERFRVCFDSLGNSCTEWQTFNSVSCGC